MTQGTPSREHEGQDKSVAGGKLSIARALEPILKNMADKMETLNTEIAERNTVSEGTRKKLKNRASEDSENDKDGKSR